MFEHPIFSYHKKSILSSHRETHFCYNAEMKKSTTSLSRKNIDDEIRRKMLALQDPEKAILLSCFFKTGKGEYAEGDRLLGIAVPVTRSVVREYWKPVSLSGVARLLKSEFHEIRLLALLMLVKRYETTNDEKTHQKIFLIYTKHTRFINNWDLVDTSAPRIVGHYLFCHMSRGDRMKFIARYCASGSLWENRIIVLATLFEIVEGRANTLFLVADKLMDHPHDLIHKSIGWMLREVGKRVGKESLRGYLLKNTKRMPRTMLRYSLEHFPKKERDYFMRSRKERSTT